jgi:hypothetical protein
LCSYYVTSLFPFYDRRDRLHIVVDVMPVINDTVWLAPNEIWHWCPDNSPQWSRVHRADFNRYSSRTPGANALLACRPSIGEDSIGNLFVTWEQFDTLNIEPRTNLMRADVWISGSVDNGGYWLPGRRLTGPDSASRRFPCVIDLAMPGTPDCDTVVVAYMEDRCAGFRSGSTPVGPWTDNPIVVRKIPADSILVPYGVSAGPTFETRVGLSVRPSPVNRRATISYDVPQEGEVTITVHDAAGRTVATLAQGEYAAGRRLAGWDASAVPTGIYFCRLTTTQATTTAKLVVQR